MRRLFTALLFVFSPLALFAQTSAPEIRFDVDIDYLKMPYDWQLGEVAGVATNSKGHIFVFERGNTQGPSYNATAAVLLEFDKDGKFIKEIGHNLYAWSYAHTVRVDKYDNIWATDKGSDMVVKFNPAGKVQMLLGRKHEASEEGGPWTRVMPPRPAVDQQFRQPTDVTWDQQDNIFVSDGYVNSRVAKYDKYGVWQKQWGEFGTGPSQFSTVHTITSDSKGNIYVGDRSNQRVQVFDNQGTLLRQIKVNLPVPPDARAAIGPTNLKAEGGQGPGAPWAICITPGQTQYLYLADSFPGRVYKLTLDGQVLGWFGKNGKQPKEFGWIHELDCRGENDLLAGELLNWRMSKITLHPERTPSSR